MPTATKHRGRIGDLLVERGIITAEQLAAALDTQQRGQQERLLGEILVDLGYVDKEQVLRALAEACGVPFVHMTPQFADPAVRNALPETFMRKHGVVPLFKVRDVLTVAMSEPSNLFLVDEIAHAAGLNVQIVAATGDDIYQTIEQTCEAARAPAEAEEGPRVSLGASGEVHLPDDYDSVYGGWPPEKVAGLLVREAVRARADAIHLEPDEKVLRVRFSIDGVLHVVMRPPTRMAAALTAAFEEMIGSTTRAAAVHDQRRSARLLVQNRAVQLHLVSLGGVFGPRAVVRLVRDDEAQMPLEKIGCDFEPLARFRGILSELRGLVLMAGPRGAGATTTLYSTINALDPIRLNICALESCINFNLPGVNQFSPATCGVTDAGTALQRLLLHQPDVLALDNVMSGTVVATALEAALDGVLVLAQIRATDAADAVARLTALASPGAVASVLRMVVAQRLTRTTCPHCRSAYEPPAPLRRRVIETAGPVEEYFKGRGCGTCGRTGFLGRIGLFELAPFDERLAAAVRAGAEPEALRQAIRAAGCPSLWVDGMNKVRAGITPVEEVVEVLSGCPAEARVPVVAAKE